MGEKEKIIEAALFMSPNTLDVNQLMQVLDEEHYSMAKKAAIDLMQEFNKRNSAMHIVQIEDSFQMRLRPEYEHKVKDLAAKALFHPGLMKTLALIAFKQPIAQALVVKYRNNKAYDHVHRLVEEGFVSREPKGRSFLLRTTKKFYEYFGKDFGKKEQP